jgi:hypothetical protein
MKTCISGADLAASILATAFALVFIAVLPGRSIAATECYALRPFDGTSVDASAIVRACIGETPSGGTLALPAGRYAIGSQIRITKPMTLRTSGLSETDIRCSSRSPSLCAELYALPAFRDRHGLLYVDQNGSAIDHIVIDGNKDGRAGIPGGAAADCAAGDTERGRSVYWAANKSSITNSVIKNALCGTGLGIGRNSNVSVISNTIISNGTHDRRMMWADGITAYDLSDATFRNNLISDNTDIDFVLGGCRNCSIIENSITHSRGFPSSSFAALVIHAWPDTTGDYTGTAFSRNSIDCGPEKRCGFGISVGAGAWYQSTTIVGAAVHDNTIVNAQMGFNIDPASTRNFQVEVYNNVVADSGGVTHTGCDIRVITSGYNITPASTGRIVRTRDKIPASAYGGLSWLAGCIPNTSIPESTLPVPSSRKSFVAHLYTCVLGRQPDETGLLNWLSMPPTSSLLSLYQAFFASPEYVAKAVTERMYVEQLYLCMLFRVPTASEVDEWVRHLARGEQRSKLVVNFIGLGEFQRTIGPRIAAASGFLFR